MGMKLKSNQTQVGGVVISRQADGYRCVDSNGSGIATVESYAEAMKVAREHNATNTLVKMVGKEEAIEMLRSGYRP